MLEERDAQLRSIAGEQRLQGGSQQAALAALDAAGLRSPALHAAPPSVSPHHHLRIRLLPFCPAEQIERLKDVPPPDFGSLRVRWFVLPAAVPQLRWMGQEERSADACTLSCSFAVGAACTAVPLRLTVTLARRITCCGCRSLCARTGTRSRWIRSPPPSLLATRVFLAPATCIIAGLAPEAGGHSAAAVGAGGTRAAEDGGAGAGTGRAGCSSCCALL